MKNRTKDLLRQMESMRLQRIQTGSVSLGRRHPERRAAAASLLAAAGLDLDNEDHVIDFLCLVAAHLLLDFRNGAEPSFPLPPFRLLAQVAAIASRSNGAKKREIIRLLQNENLVLAAKTISAITQQFDRVARAALDGKLNLTRQELRKFSQIRNTIERLAPRRRYDLPGSGSSD